MASNEQIFNDGEAYERSMGRWSRRVGAQFLDWIAPAKGLNWIDVGCGNGAFTEVLVERCSPHSVTGVDPSEGQIAHARAHAAGRPVVYRVGDAQAIPFRDAQFDAASMALVISFVPDPQKAVNEMARVTRPGGPVATYMWDFAKGGVPSSPIGREMKRMGVLPPPVYDERSSRAEVLDEMWRAAGLVDVETKALTIEVEFENFDDFWISFAHGGATAKLLASLDAGTVERVREAVLAAVPAQADGRLRYEARANAIKGRVPG